MEMARERYRLSVSDDGEPFALPHEGANVARLMRGSRSLRSELGKAYFAAKGRAAPGSALSDALNVLEGMALEGEREAVHLRVAPYNGGIVVDLGTEDGAAIVVEPGRWHWVERSPVVFRRTNAMAAMPAPAETGDLEPLRKLLNVSEDNWPLLVGWAVAGLLPWLPHPVLLLAGEQGTAKSTAGRILTALIDPSGAQLRRAPTDPTDWVAQASASWAVCLDNVSTVPRWLSDAMCRAVTGDGSVDRTLYTNLDVTVTSFRRVLCLTSIEAGHIHGDLAERLLVVELERIGEEKRREEAVVMAEFEAAHARVLGGLLTLTARVLEALPHTRPGRLPRMADFCRVLAALDAVTGWESLKTYRDRLGDALRAVVDDDLVARAVIAFMGDRVGAEWQGTATDLLKALTAPDPKPKEWPATPAALGGALTRLGPALMTYGIHVDRGKSNGRRVLNIKSKSWETPVPADPDPPADRDRDGGDGKSGAFTFDLPETGGPAMTADLEAARARERSQRQPLKPEATDQ